jgi:hypothetical protein
MPLSRSRCSFWALRRISGTGESAEDPSADVNTKWRTPAAFAASIRLREPTSSTISSVSGGCRIIADRRCGAGGDERRVVPSFVDEDAHFLTARE